MLRAARSVATAAAATVGAPGGGAHVRWLAAAAAAAPAAAVAATGGPVLKPFVDYRRIQDNAAAIHANIAARKSRGDVRHTLAAHDKYAALLAQVEVLRRRTYHAPPLQTSTSFTPPPHLNVVPHPTLNRTERGGE